MHQTLCAQVAHRLGEPLRTIERRGFQPVTKKEKKNDGDELSAVDCPFCGGQVLVVVQGDTVDAECRGCETAFEASVAEVYTVSLHETERPKLRRFPHEIW